MDEEREESSNNATESEIEDSGTSEDETVQITTEKEHSRLNKHRKYLKGLNQKTLVARRRINTLVNTIRVLRQHCNDLPVKEEKLQALCSVNGSDFDSSSDESEKLENAPKKSSGGDVKDPNYQEHLLNECSSVWANSVQVVLLGENKKTKFLEKKVEMAAERDVALSQELLLLKNQIFLKTKHVEDLKSDVARLKEEAETQIFGP